jgi:hypothetical protein
MVLAGDDAGGGVPPPEALIDPADRRYEIARRSRVRLASRQRRACGRHLSQRFPGMCGAIGKAWFSRKLAGWTFRGAPDHPRIWQLSGA